MNRIAAVVAGLSLAFVGTSATIAATINVPGDQPTIAAAINAAVTGDVINIAAGTYNEVNLNPVGKAITIQGTRNTNGSLATTIDAQQMGRVFVFNNQETSATVIRDLVITGGYANVGGGISIRNSSYPTISGCIIAHNAASSKGGGIMADNASSPSVIGCTFTSNSSNVSGGAMYAEYNSSPFVDNCTFIGNTAGYQGGAAMANNTAAFLIFSSTMSLNLALEGGAIYCSSNSFLHLSNSKISSNIATGYPESACPGGGCPAGGGISHRNPLGLLITDGSRICGNNPDNIAGNYLADGAMIAEDTCIIFECRDEDCDGDYDGDDVRIAMANFGITEGTPGDVDGDGAIDVNDLDSLHASLNICPHDIDHDGVTDIDDLLRFLAGYGATCP